MGVIALQTSDRNGALVGALQLSEHHDLMLISDQGTMVRTRASEIAQVGRNTQGVTLMRVAAGERLIALEAIEVIEGETTGDDSAPETTDEAPAPSAPN
jgi:DNA gyrase subunit A